MANTKYSDLLPYVLPELKGCSAPLAELHIRSSVIELCRTAKVWVVAADDQYSEPGVADYDIELPQGAALVEVDTLLFDGAELSPALPSSAMTLAPGKPLVYTQSDLATVSLSPAPSSAAVIRMTLALQPTRSSTAFPGWIGEKYHDAIVAGAKARLMMMQGHSWSNAPQALIYKNEFSVGVADASGSAARAFLRTTLRTTPQH